MSVVHDLPVQDTAVLEAVAAPLPRVNLLPPEIGERQRFRRIQLGLCAGLLTATGVVALLYVGAVGSTTDAAAELAATSSRGASLRAQTNEYAEVQRIHAEAGAAKTMLSQAMAGEIRFSTLLDDLSRSVPDDVWLDNVTFTQTSASAPDAVAAGTSAGVGTVTFAGLGGEHDDVAVWLESLAAQERFADASFTKSTAGTVDGRPSVSFTSTATLSPAALSGRYADVEGG